MASCLRVLQPQTLSRSQHLAKPQEAQPKPGVSGLRPLRLVRLEETLQSCLCCFGCRGEKIYEAAQEHQCDMIVTTSMGNTHCLDVAEKLNILCFALKFCPDIDGQAPLSTLSMAELLSLEPCTLNSKPSTRNSPKSLISRSTRPLRHLSPRF